MPELPPTRELIRGAVTHQILNLALRDFRRGVDLPMDVTDQATDLLSKYPELSAADVEYETQLVAELAGFALDHFNTECEVVMAEDELSYLHQEQFRLMSRTDAILRQPDGVFEVIDWKTGNSDYIDRIQTLFLYIGALTFLKREFSAGPEHVRLTFAFLGHRKYQSIPVDRESSKPVWKEIATYTLDPALPHLASTIESALRVLCSTSKRLSAGRSRLPQYGTRSHVTCTW
jgi:hypothetical protein